MSGRSPILTSLPIEVLRPELRTSLDLILPTVKTEKIKHQFIRDLLMFQVMSQRANVPTQTARTRYGGALIVQPFFNRMGAYNPEKYPVPIIDKMREDAHINLGMSVMTGIIRGLEWSIECQDDKQRVFLKYAITKIYSNLIRSLTMAMFYGFSSNELVWTREKTNLQKPNLSTSGARQTLMKETTWCITQIRDHHPSTIRAVVHPRTGDFLGISQTSLEGDLIYLRKGYKLLFFGFDQEYGNWFGKSRLAPAYKHWYWGEVFLHYLARYMERRGTPPVVVRAPNGRRIIDGQEIEAMDLGLRLGMALLENAVVTLPSEYDIKGNQLWNIEYLNDDKRAEMFERILNYFDAAKLRGLGIPDRAMSQDMSPGGTSSGAEASRDLLMVTLSSLIHAIEDIINRHIVRPLQEVNFLDSSIVDASFVFQRPDLNRTGYIKELIVEGIREIPNTGLPRVMPSIEAMCRLLNIPIEEVKTQYAEPTPQQDVAQQQVDIAAKTADQQAKQAEQQAKIAEQQAKAQAAGNTEQMTNKEIAKAEKATAKKRVEPK